MRKLKVGIIGCGNMGYSILEGIISLLPSRNIFVSDKKKSVLRKIKESGVNICSNKEVAENSEIIIIAVKPQDIEEVLKDIKDKIDPSKTIISIAAGVKIKKIEKFLNGKIPVIRVMPNLCVKVKEGIIAYSCGKFAKGKGKIVESLFSRLGIVFEIDEKKMDLITAISGSGPGYIFYFAEIFEKICRKEGLKSGISGEIVSQLFYGAGKMIKEMKKPKKLKEEVCSPGGTTIEGIKVFEKYNLERIFEEVIEKAKKRREELSN